MVPETERSSALIERRTGPVAAGIGLIEQPSVDQNVGSDIRRVNLDGIQQIIPKTVDLLSCGVHMALFGIRPHDGSRGIYGFRFSDQENKGVIRKRSHFEF